MFALDPSPTLINGVPATLLTLNMLPGENGIPESLIVFVALGLSISTIVDPTKSISNPLTYAVPADTFTDNESSDGIFPSSVI